MRVVVMGCGRVGSSLADGLSRIGHDVAVIDRDSSAFNRLSPEFAGERVLLVHRRGDEAGHGPAVAGDQVLLAGLDLADAAGEGWLASRRVMVFVTGGRTPTGQRCST